MKKFNLKLQPNLRPKKFFGEIGKNMEHEYDEKPTVFGISNDYEDHIEFYIDRNTTRIHEEDNRVSKKYWRIG